MPTPLARRPDRGAALALVLVLILCGSWPHRRRVPGAASPPCERPLVVDGPDADRLVCDPAALSILAAVCPLDAAPVPGDRVAIAFAGGACHLVVRPLPAPLRLALGLRLDVNIEPGRALEAVPGIGAATARALVAARPYGAWEEIERARGIGPKRRAALARYLVVRGATARPPRPRPGPSLSPRLDASSPRKP